MLFVLYWSCLCWINAFSSLFVVATLFAEFKKRCGGVLVQALWWDLMMIIFLIFNEMFVLKKCIFKTGTLVQEPNPRAVLMFLVWMRFSSCTFPHPIRNPEHQPAVYFRVQAHTCPWHLSDFCSVLEERGFDTSFWSLFAFGFIPHTVGYMCSDSSAGGGWCGCVNCCLQLFLGTKLLWGEASVSCLSVV